MEKEIIKETLECIKKERPNFLHIINKEPYSDNPYHRKAVEVYSFELLEKAINNLQKIKKFEPESSEILGHIYNKNAKEVYNLLDNFEKILTKYYESIKLNNAPNEEIFELKPNLWGIGVNLKALWRKFIKK